MTRTTTQVHQSSPEQNPGCNLWLFPIRAVAPWLAPLTGAENRAFCRMARKFRKNTLPESERAAFLTLRERVRNTMPPAKAAGAQQP